MKKAKIGKTVTALVLVLTTMMACVTSTFADYETSDPIYKTVGGVEFKIDSELYINGNRTFRGAVYVVTVDQSLVPAKTILVQAELYEPNSAQAVCYSEWDYNDKADYWAYAVTPYYNSDNIVRAAGGVQIYDGTKYVPIEAPSTRYSSRSQDVSDELKATLDANGNYPKTANGETYGSGLLSSIVGYKPDLISAIGTNGLSGYIRNEDASPIFVTKEEYEIYIVNLEAAGRKIPLYDLQGNVIGDFEIGESEDVIPGAESPEVVREAIEREMDERWHSGLEETRAYFAGEGSTNQDIQLASSDEIRKTEERLIEEWLVNGEYKKTDDGKTYGPSGLAAIVGKRPDLIGVIGNSGKSGYITIEDYNPLLRCKTPAEIDEYFSNLLNEGDRTVPVYDLNGNIIDEMTFYKSEKPFA